MMTCVVRGELKMEEVVSYLAVPTFPVYLFCWQYVFVYDSNAGSAISSSIAGEMVAYHDFNLSLTATPVVGTDDGVEDTSCVEVDNGISNFFLQWIPLTLCWSRA